MAFRSFARFQALAVCVLVAGCANNQTPTIDYSDVAKFAAHKQGVVLVGLEMRLNGFEETRAELANLPAWMNSKLNGITWQVAQ